MEVALGAFYQTWDGDNLLVGELLKGQVRSWFSLELVSIGGEIHFVIGTQKFFKNIVEAQIYAQYPEVEIVEVPDYTKNIPYGLPGSDWELFGTEFTLSKEDAYPIKTYVQYGLDKAVKEQETQTDPLTATLEFLGSIGPGAQVWIQILVMATKKRYRKPGTLFGKEDWKDNAKALIEKLMKFDRVFRGGPDESFDLSRTMLSPGERTVVEEVERSISKLGFDCGMRGIYLAKKDKFTPMNIVGLLGSVKQYNSLNLNGFKITNRTGVKYPWQDPFGNITRRKKATMFDAYRRRSYFYSPYIRKPFVLNTEELATIYHFPGRVATTPTLAKIESKRAEAPVDLPI